MVVLISYALQVVVVVVLKVSIIHLDKSDAFANALHITHSVEFVREPSQVVRQKLLDATPLRQS